MIQSTCANPSSWVTRGDPGRVAPTIIPGAPTDPDVHIKASVKLFTPIKSLH
jgi:hypothetical protein